jgi:hypothetical protein
MKATERRASHSAAALRRSPTVFWVSLDRDTGCHALSVAGTVSLCTRLSVATFAIISDLVGDVVTGRIRCDLIGSKLCNARNCKEVNFCTSSVATANIPPSKIIGNQKKSGTAQLLEVGPRSREFNCSAGFRDTGFRDSVTTNASEAGLAYRSRHSKQTGGE